MCLGSDRRCGYGRHRRRRPIIGDGTPSAISAIAPGAGPSNLASAAYLKNRRSILYGAGAGDECVGDRAYHVSSQSKALVPRQEFVVLAIGPAMAKRFDLLPVIGPELAGKF